MNDSNDRSSSEYETRRLKALADYKILDTPRDPAFDEIVELISLICDAPIAVINFIEQDRQWFKSEKGLGIRETPRDISICSHALQQSGLFIVRDTTEDPRFASNPLVAGEPHLRFYAGALLESQDGYPLGTLCVLDYQPRDLTEGQRFALRALANQVMAHMELMKAHRVQAELICELEATREKLVRHATTDPLSGLLNRRAFEQRYDQEISNIRRGAPSAALMLIDLDQFKTVNDTLGHNAGDQIIVRFTQLCRETFREADVIGRWGGDEFLVLLPATSLAVANAVAERLHQSLATIPMLDDSSPLSYCTASIGICAVTALRSLDDCVQRTDRLLYQAKEQGRNGTVCEPD